MQNKLKFEVIKKQGNARVGKINLNGVEVTTPIFMPVGTKATIKGLILDLLEDPKYIGDLPSINIILSNTYHLFLNPGDDIVKQAGGLHKFQNRDGLILTDSGGFQIFSLGLDTRKKNGEKLVKIFDEGVSFISPYSGDKHFLSPEKIIDIQSNLGSDIMMVLDVCSPVSKEKDAKTNTKKQMDLTHKRADKAFGHFIPKYKKTNGVLFPIIQGGLYKDLREESMQYLKQYAYDGIAIGGVSVGETNEEKYQVLDRLKYGLPEDKPRYLMGVGDPEDILNCIDKGVDIFDCVLPTRLGRHGIAFTNNGTIKLYHSKYRNDFSLLDNKCNFFTGQNFSKAYIHFLIKEGEMLGAVLLSLHNILYLHKIIEDKKSAILAN